ncbi:hypothetical protein [Novosphingobium rosa]|uniref:hypothetical protein n=1 Tax=Novosphingobium rosa TaxID=76978 RepID=UPI0008336BE8|nr:hypothetical protein [Novosphingobium rosa]
MFERPTRIEDRPLLIGLNPSPVAETVSWSTEAKSTGALAYLAFDRSRDPGECRRWFDMRNLNERIIDRKKISRIDPAQAMERLREWDLEGRLAGPVVACGQTVGLMVRAYRAATGAEMGSMTVIPHPSLLWRPRFGISVRAWQRARNDLRRVLGFDAQPDPVDEEGIDNALQAFVDHLEFVEMKRILDFEETLDAQGDEPTDAEKEEWAEEVTYWRRVAALDEVEDHAERLDAAVGLIEDGCWNP